MVQFCSSTFNLGARFQMLSDQAATRTPPVLTLPAVKVNTGRKMMASLPSGILVQTAASTVMIAPDCKVMNTVVRTADNIRNHGMPRL